MWTASVDKAVYDGTRGPWSNKKHCKNEQIWKNRDAHWKDEPLQTSKKPEYDIDYGCETLTKTFITIRSN